MSLNIALTGILAANTDLGVVSDNIANAATTGFKRSRAEFGDLVDSMSRQGTGLGVRLQKINQSFKQGTIENTDGTFDMAVVGDGFFQVKSGTQILYTRAGSFHADDDGYIVNNLLQNVQGYEIKVSEPTASSEVSLGVTLNGNGLIHPASGFNPDDQLTYNHATTVSVYDSKGFPHTLRSYYLMVATSSGDTDWQVYHKMDNNPEIIDGLTVEFDNTTGLPTTTSTLIQEFPPVELGTGANTLSLVFNYNDLRQGSEFNTFSVTVNGAPRSREVNSIVGNLKIDTSTMQPKMTSEVGVGINLNSLKPAPFPTVNVEYMASLGGAKTGATSGISGAFDSADPTTYTHVNSQQIYDSLGVNHSLKTYFVGTTSGDTWNVYYTLDNNHTTSGGTIEFDPTTGVPDLTGVNTPITFSTAQLGSGASPLPIVPDFSRVRQMSGAESETTSVVATTPSANPDTIDATDPRNYDFPTAISIYDSLGIDHSLNLYFRKIADNRWSVYRQFSEMESIAQRVATITFDSRGLPVEAIDGEGFTDPMDPLSLRMTAISFGNGAGRQNVVLNFEKMTQFDSEFTIDSLRQDGYTMGQFSGVEADESGNIIASYSNNETQIMGQVVLARFANTQGLKRQGDNNWAATSQSGPAVIGRPGNSSLGTLVVGALEGSNVEMTRELVDMITAQRNFQANAQVINTTGTLYQAVLNIR